MLFSIITVFTGCGFDVTTNISNDANITSNKQEIVFQIQHPTADNVIDLENRIFSVNTLDRKIDTKVEIIQDDNNKTINIIYKPSDEFTLPEGNVSVRLEITYKNKSWWHYSKNAIEEELTFTVDSISPSIETISPKNNENIVDSLIPLVYKIIDTGVGVDKSSIKILINNEDKTDKIIFENSTLTYTPTSDSPLPSSSFKVEIIASDIFGNETSEIFSYIIQPKIILGVFPRAVPQISTPGTQIRFSPVITTDTAIQRYDWDFDGDGRFDRGDIVGNTHYYTFRESGDYNVSLKVRDANGKILIGNTIVHIQNLPPEVRAEATPSNGEIPLDVSFAVSATDNEGIINYEWDFNGNGNYDYESTTTANVHQTYNTIGKFFPTLRITDSKGIKTEYTLPTTVINALEKGSPSVAARANVYKGNAPLNVGLSATAIDPLNKTFTLWEWDYDGDGVYDYSSNQNANINYTFKTAGTHFPRVRVTTEDGRQSVDVVEVKVSNVISISRNIDTIDTALGEVVNIRTTMGADTEISIVVENRNNQLIRTLVNWEKRDAGTYSDTWDGLSNEGNKISEGDYYVVLLYKNDGEIKRLDLRNSTGGAQFRPSRNNAARSFAPFDNNPMSITFTLPKAAEVTAFIGYSMPTNMRVATFFTRKPFPKGTHTVKWHSTNNKGVIIKPVRYFMYGNWGYALANNAIYVKSGAHITGVSVEPVIYDPTSHKEEGLRSTSNISFNLTADASVELSLVDAITGVLMVYKKYDNLKAGQNTIKWDGKNNIGEFIAPGKFTIGVRAIDSTGYRSLTQYTLQRIYY